MTKKILLCVAFFVASPFALFLSFYLYALPLRSQVLGEAISFTPNANTGHFFAALPQDTGVVAPVVVSGEAIPIMIENYLKHYQSPLLPFKDNILELAKKYGVKPELIVAIAQQESNLGKKSPDGCFNAWGWGIHAKGTTCFSTWEEAIEAVTRGIAMNYCSKGYCEDPCIMMKKYTPRSNGSWCAGVNQFLEELESGNF